MARVLVVFSTIDGQTARIAGRIGQAITRLGHGVTLRSSGAHGDFADIEAHDAVIVGAAIRYGHYSRALEAQVKAKRAAIEARPNAFFSVCLSAGGPGARPTTAEGYLRDFRAHTGWNTPHVESFAGALLYRRYNPFIRFMMRLIVGFAGGETDTSRDYEYTDWDGVERFAARFAAGLAGS